MKTTLPGRRKVLERSLASCHPLSEGGWHWMRAELGVSSSLTCIEHDSLPVHYVFILHYLVTG